MQFEKMNISTVILNQYHQSWWLWITFLVIGALLVKYSDVLGTSRRSREKMLTSGAGLIAIGLVIYKN